MCPALGKECLKKMFNPNSYSLANSILRQLPVVSNPPNFVGKVPGATFSEVKTTPIGDPKLIAKSDDCLSSILDLDPDAVANDPNFIDFVSGNKIPYSPLSHRYGGHQFAVWADQLGDGRAHLIGEYLNRKGERWELQLKGSGRTPYSRFGDGRAVLRSSIREFLASEHLNALGIPTSRAATLILSGSETAIRDQFYSGRPKKEPVAVLLRLAPSWFRIGSLEILFFQNEIELLRKLTDFIIENFFQDLAKSKRKYLDFFAQICDRTAKKIAMWQSVGFSHGVLNTDNFSILGLTIDFGPFGFLDRYDPNFVPNHSDGEGMYSFGRQPDVGLFNLRKLAIALGPLLQDSEVMQISFILEEYRAKYENYFLEIMRKKFGLKNGEKFEDKKLIENFLEILKFSGADFSLAFREFSELNFEEIKNCQIPEKKFPVLNSLEKRTFYDWLKNFAKRLEFEKKNDENFDEKKRLEKMRRENPRYILRNWMAESAIRKATGGDFQEIQFLLQILTRPYDENAEAEMRGYAGPVPDWAGSLRVSCSS